MKVTYSLIDAEGFEFLLGAWPEVSAIPQAVSYRGRRFVLERGEDWDPRDRQRYREDAEVRIVG